MIVTLPHHTFNAAIKDGTVNDKMGKIMDAIKPQAAYFSEINGKRTAFLIIELTDNAQIPSLAEPWFLTFEADVQFHPTMIPSDLQRAGLDQLGKKW
jgi:hypothetical protein